MPRAGFRVALPGEADRVVTRNDDAVVAYPVNDRDDAAQHPELQKSPVGDEASQETLSSFPGEDLSPSELNELLVGPSALIEYSNRADPVFLEATGIVYSRYLLEPDPIDIESGHRSVRAKSREYYDSLFARHQPVGESRLGPGMHTNISATG